MSEPSSRELLKRFEAGQSAAATAIFDRYVERLLALARSKMSPKLTRRIDADDVVQDVLMAISKDVTAFEHNGRTGAFRAWVKGILVNRLRKFWSTRDRGPAAAGGSDMYRRLAELDDPASQMTLVWNEEHDQHVLGELMTIVKSKFELKTWAAFQMTALEGMKPQFVAEKLEISLNAVLIAKSRVLSRLRREAAGLVESSSQIREKS